MTIAEITAKIEEISNNKSPLGHTVKFDFKDGDVVFVDSTGEKSVVSNDDNDAECVLKITKENFEKLLDGSLKAPMAMMFGKLKIKGDMGVAMKLQSMFG